MSKAVGLANQKNFTPNCFTLTHLMYYYYYCYYLTVYFLYINANFGVVHSVKYSELPKVYDYEHECIVDNKDIRTCPDKAWHVIPKMRLFEHFDHRYTNLDTCLDWCRERDCVAVYFQTDHNWCAIYHNNYGSRMTDDTFRISYILKCCQLEKNQKSQLHYHQLPVVLNESRNCLSQIETNINWCNSKAFQQVERKWPVEDNYKNMEVTDTFECMNRCLEDEVCKAFRVHMESLVFVNCYFYKTGVVEADDVRYSHVFKKICCQTNEEKLWIARRENLLMLYQPNAVCNTTSKRTRLNCNVPFWHVQDNTKATGSFKNTHFNLLRDTLNDCIKNMQCEGVSIDWLNEQANYFNAYASMLNGQKKWTSYTLECCHGFKKLNEKTDKKFLENLPIVTDIRHECFVPKHFNPKICSHKAWQAVERLQLKKEIHIRDNLNQEECFHLCLLNKDCIAVMREISSMRCFLYSDEHDRLVDRDHVTTYLLKCCELREPKRSL